MFENKNRRPSGDDSLEGLRFFISNVFDTEEILHITKRQ